MSMPSPPELPDLDAPALRTCNKDGSIHFSELKKMALSGTQYLHACNAETVPTRDMRIGTIVHFLLLGPRPGGKRIIKYDGRRAGAAWDAFEAKHSGKDIVTATEWAEAEQIADGVRQSPVAMDRLRGARLEVPLSWEEDGVRFATSGVDILCEPGDISDLKVTSSTYPETWERQAIRMLYPQQLAFYARGARANGITTRGLFVLGVERKAPFEVVELEMTERMIEFAEKSISLWLEKLRVYRLSCPEPATVRDWPGYAQSPRIWDLPAWADDEEEEEDVEEDGEAMTLTT